MGKKQKRKDEAFSSSPKKLKVSAETSTPQRPQTTKPAIPIRYEDMPLNHKKKFYIHDDCGGLQKYIEIISWLRTMGCYAGTVFEGIPNLNWVTGQGYPLVEIEVVSPRQNSAKFIISKNLLYLIAFYSLNGWFQFVSDDYILNDFTVLESYDGRYVHKPWETLGPKAMIDAVDLLATTEFNVNGVVTETIRAWETFFVHLCEAARLYPIESFVCKGLTPPPQGPCNDVRTFVEEEARLLSCTGGVNVTLEDDIYRLVKNVSSIDFNVNLQTPGFFKELVHHYSDLTKAWCVYALSDKIFLPLREEHVEETRARSIKSVRCTLAVLCNINLEKVIKEWKKKSKNHEFITVDVYNKIESRIRELQAQRLVRTGDI